MKLLCALVLVCAFSSSASAKNYAQVICDNEPDPVTCKNIQTWYRNARQPAPITTSCCGEGDAYWADQVDKVTKTGTFVTITDKRDCPPPTQPGYEDEDGNYVAPQPQATDCISSRKPRDGQRIFVPNEKLDNRYQGNPTGHNVVFIQLNAQTYYLEDGVGYPSILCAFLEFPG